MSTRYCLDAIQHDDLDVLTTTVTRFPATIEVLRSKASHPYEHFDEIPIGASTEPLYYAAALERMLHEETAKIGVDTAVVVYGPLWGREFQGSKLKAIVINYQ